MTNNRELSILEQVPPKDPGAEAAVLGSIILAPHVIDDVSMLLRPEHFYFMQVLP